MAFRRPLLALSLAGVALLGVTRSALNFVGVAGRGVRGCHTVARVSAEYLERCGPKDADVPFTAAPGGPEHPVTFKKRPFGILRYQPGAGMKGAMAMEIIPKSRYPGDPQGQAFSSGVQGGWVVKSINGQDVLTEDFGKIMDLLDDEVADPRFSKSTALALEKQGGRMAEPAAAPLEVVFTEIPGYQVRPLNVSVTNHAIGGTTVDAWQKILSGSFVENLRDVHIAIMALSLGNEGLSRARSAEQIAALERHYLDGLHAIVRRLREVLPSGARLVLGGPYPHGHYSRKHLEALERVRAAMSSWVEVDYVINFLQPSVLGADGTWASGIENDPGHPNTEGHARMFSCVRVEELLGRQGALPQSRL